MGETGGWEYESYQKRIKEGEHEFSVFPRDDTLPFLAARLASQLFLRGFLKLYNRLAFVNREVVAAAPRPCVLVANHSSHYDALVLLAALPLREVNVAFAAAAKDYFFSNVWRGMMSLAVVNALPFDRQQAKRESLELCADLLQAGRKILIMFPEGTRSESGEIHPFKWGIGKLVAGNRTTVVPAYLEGAARAWPRDRVLPAPRRIRVVFGSPRTFEDVPSTEAGWKAVAATLEADVRRLAVVG